MHRWIVILAAVLLVGLIPLVQAQEEEQPPAQAKPAEAKPAEGARLLERFDLDKDGRVTWEEFQKVRSGFAFLDADGDGVLTAKDAEQLKQRHAAKREERRKERAHRGPRGRHPRGERFRRRPDCDCPCHRGEQPRFRGPPRHDGPRGFRDRGPRGRGWGRGPEHGRGRPHDDRPPPPDRRGPY
jgi:hypothetical protein